MTGRSCVKGYSDLATVFILLQMYLNCPYRPVRALEQKCPERCSCNFFSGTVLCVNTQFTDTKVFKQLPEHTREVVFTGNFIPEIPGKLLGECNSSYARHILLDKLDISNNSIMSIRSDSFNCMPHLRTLILSFNHLEIKNHTGIFSDLMSLERLELKQAFLSLVNSTEHMKQLGEAFKEAKMPKLKILHLERNSIRTMTSDGFHIFCPLPKLKKLYLSHNYISHPGLDPCAKNLEELHLDNNSIPFLNDATIKLVEDLPELLFVNITDNPLICDCQIDNFYKFLKETVVSLDREELKCVAGYPVSNVGRRITGLHSSDLRCKDTHPRTAKLNASYIIMGCIFGILILLFFVVMYLNRGGIKATLKKCIDPFTSTYSSVSL